MLCDNVKSFLEILRKIPIVAPEKKSEANRAAEKIAGGAAVAVAVIIPSEASEGVSRARAGDTASTSALTCEALDRGIRVGSRVRYLGKGSQRCGMIGTVKSIDGSIASVWLDYHKGLPQPWRELGANLLQLELVE